MTVNPQPTLTVTNKTQTGLFYGDNIQLIEITNTNSNLTVTPAGTYSHIQYNSGTKTITSSDYLTVGTYKYFLQAVSDQTPECNTLRDTVIVVVSPKLVTLVSGDASKMYDGSPITNADVPGKNANGLVTETGWVGDDGATYTFTGEQLAVGSSPNAFSYTAKTGTDLSNYTISKTEGTLSITSNTSVLYVELKDKTWTYNGSAHTNHEYVVHFGDAELNATAAGNGTYTATLGTGDVVTITPDANATITNVAETTVDNTFTWTVQNSTFYTKGTDTVGKLAVTCKAVTITAKDSTKTYDGQPMTQPAFTASALEATDHHTFTVAMTSGSTITNVGTQANVIAKIDGVDVTAGSGNVVGNYCVTVVNGELKVTCKAVTITANSTGFFYDGSEHSDPGFSVTGLVGSDEIRAVVTGSIQFPQQSPQVNTLANYNFTTGNPNNYCVSTYNGQLTMGWNPICSPITVKSNSHTWVYDGTSHSDDGYTLIFANGTIPVGADGIFEFPNSDTLRVDVTGTVTTVGSVDNIPTVTSITKNGYDVSQAYCVTLDTGKLVVTPRELLIVDTLSKKTYDGAVLVVNYNNPDVEVTGLVEGDYLTAGQFTTHNYKAGYYRRTVRPLTTAMMAEDVTDITTAFETHNGISNYRVTIIAKLTITPRSLEITAASETMVYNCVDLEKDAYTITDGTLANTDLIDTVFVAGSQHCVGSSSNVASGAIILHGIDTVTNSYDITYVDGSLTIEPVTTGFECPAPLDITLWHSTSDTNVTLPAPATLTPSLPCVTITNNLVNPLPAGVHTITWSLKDECGTLMTNCQQIITVNYPKCDTAIDFDGNKYPSERIGRNCWTVINLRSEHYSDGTDIANYTFYNNNDSLENVYGKLYSWYSAARVPEDDDSAVPVDSTSLSGPYVEGVCPAGWALPTVEEYWDMYVASGADAGLVKSPSTLVWLPGKQGTAPNKFDAYGAGYYDGSVNRYFNLLGETHFWAVDYSTGSSMARNFVLNYYCSEGLVVESMKGFGYSIRCVQKK